ncbi:MAG: nuclear transport factor 2 family protein [Nocardioides sp.]|nr:nuclear transport factor 2 family protein [Nocardioides sp.]
MVDSAREIENLLYDYAERIDAGDFDGVADLFTHARIHGRENGPPETVFEGREGALRLYEMSTRRYDDGTPKTHHITTNARIEVDDDAGTATCRSYFCVAQATDALPLQMIITGRYHDTFQRLDGRWWFASRTMFVDQMGDLSQHLKW